MPFTTSNTVSETALIKLNYSPTKYQWLVMINAIYNVKYSVGNILDKLQRFISQDIDITSFSRTLRPYREYRSTVGYWQMLLAFATHLVLNSLQLFKPICFPLAEMSIIQIVTSRSASRSRFMVWHLVLSTHRWLLFWFVIFTFLFYIYRQLFPKSTP